MGARWFAIILMTCATAAAQRNYFTNPDIKGPKGWANYPVDPAVTFEIDRKTGHDAPGSLRIESDLDDGRPCQWRQVCDVSEAEGRRFRLGARVRAADVEPGAKVVIVAQCWDEDRKQIGFVYTPSLEEDTTAWHDLDVVFDAPSATRSIFVMAYIINRGEVWFDDFVLEETEDAVTFPPPRGAAASDSGSRYQDLARGLATDLPWTFSAEDARRRAKERRAPILVYVRCTDDTRGLPSALSTLRADDVRFGDDGYMKDLLFRGGPLTDAAVRDLVSRRFVPLCATYHLGSQGRGNPFAFWHATRGVAGVEAEVDRESGASAPGSLVVRVEAPRLTGTWSQSVHSIRPGAKLSLTASVRTGAVDEEASVRISIRAAADGKPGVVESRLIPAGEGWRPAEVSLVAPAGTRSVVVALEVSGRAEAWFDDLALRADGGDDLLADGGVDHGTMPDPLETFDATCAQVVTPALLVIGSNGSVARRLHRIGALSADLVDRWLREALDAVGSSSRAEEAAGRLRDGDLSGALAAVGSGRGEAPRLVKAEARMRLGQLDKARRALEGLDSPAALRLRALVALRRGDWKAGEELFGRLREGESGFTHEASYWQGHCQYRLGREKDARATWRAAVGESPYGRKAALALVGNGPRPWLAESVRAWPEKKKLPEQTETADPGGFDVAESVRALLELQRGDGAFSGNTSVWDAAITAVAVDAIDAWTRKLRSADRAAAEAARDRALTWLEGWAGRPATQVDPFNAPYVLEVLVRHERDRAAGSVVAKLLAIQRPCGNWSVYGDHRPASFNTAQAVIALTAAKRGGLDVDASAYRRGVDALAAMRQEGDLFPYSTAPGHDWMTTVHGAIGRDPLCERALLVAKRTRKKATVDASLERFLAHHEELRAPTKKLYDYFNSRGHGGYFFFYSHRNAVEAAAQASSKIRKRVRRACRDAVLRAREGDGTFMDHYVIGRAYATAMALVILART